MLSAAVDMSNAVQAPVFKMLTPDPIYNYANPKKRFPDYPFKSGCPTLEPVWAGGNVLKTGACTALDMSTAAESMLRREG